MRFQAGTSSFLPKSIAKWQRSLLPVPRPNPPRRSESEGRNKGHRSFQTFGAHGSLCRFMAMLPRDPRKNIDVIHCTIKYVKGIYINNLGATCDIANWDVFGTLSNLERGTKNQRVASQQDGHQITARRKLLSALKTPALPSVDVRGRGNHSGSFTIQV